MEKTLLDDFTKYALLSGIEYSPDGKYACFSVSKADCENNNYSSNLWLYNVNNNSCFQLTALNKENKFIWLKDSEHILFPGVRDPKDKQKLEDGEEFTQFYKINVHGGEAVEAFRVNKLVADIKQIDENTYLFTSITDIDKKDSDPSDKKEEKDYEIIDEIPFWSNGTGFVNKKRLNLFIYSAKTDKYKLLADAHLNINSFHLSKDNKKLVFTANEFTDKMELYNDIFLLDLGSGKIEKLSQSNTFCYNYVDFISDKKLIIMGSNMQKYGVNENDKFYTLDLTTKEKICLTPDFETSTWNSVSSDCRYGSSQHVLVNENYLYFITTENYSSYINRIDLSGTIQKVSTNTGSVDGFAVNNDCILFIGFRDNKLQEIYKLQNGIEKQVTEFNDWIQTERNIAVPEKLTVETAPGVTIDGWILKPVDFDKDKKYPAIFDIHGGPKVVYGDIFFHEMQYFASQGYAVFFCNPRGSDGKGNAFSDIRGKYGTIDYDDLMKFMDTVLKNNNFIDPDRIGVTGGSYGGFMTNWIIGHTDRFKAAASQRSISNWISKFNTTDIGYFFVGDQIAATPWNNFEKLWQHSPLKYADKVKTPTLFLHSNEDYRCWMAEGLQMFTALKYHGVPSKLVLFRGENHELSRSGKPKHRVRRLKEIVGWFDKYLK